MINLDSFFGVEPPRLSEYFSFTQQTQCVPFDGCKLTILMSLENGPFVDIYQHCSKTKMKGLVVFFYLMLLYFLNYVYEQNH